MLQDLELLSLSYDHLNVEFLLQILLVIICGAIIGSERKARSKPLGMRTSILIGLGTMMFVKYGLFVLAEGITTNADPSRVTGQVVTGIGFLGAGTIMNREGLVVGLTTAATIWVQAAIGVIIAYGYLVDAILLTIVTWFILSVGSKIEAYMKKVFKKKKPVTVKKTVFSPDEKK